MRRFWAVLALAIGLAGIGAVVLDRLFPPALGRLAETSTVVADRTGQPLRIFTTPSGLWRLPAGPDAVSPLYLRLLVDIEDRRFVSHPGVDPAALLRAAMQWITRGRVVSGGSTLTMQVVRLLEPRPRTLRSKLIEIARALQLEAHASKRDILAAYLTLAPMGRNIEGVRAGSLAWFGKEPDRLSDAEAALLVALPRDPTRLRPDRVGAPTAAARARVLRRGVADGILAAATLDSALAAPLPDRRRPQPLLAPHLAEELAAEAPPGMRIDTTLDAAIQAGAERLLARVQQTLPRPVTLAAIVADWRGGAVLARIGSADYFDAGRRGAVDMTHASRSPGSTLKPFIYGMAFDGLLAHPGTLVQDAATRFDDYAPHNFDGGFNGDVTIRQALQASLNLPAVVTLQRLGPVVFTQRFKAAGLPLDLGPSDAAPGLPIALGGVGTSLETLVTAYAALANGGTVTPLHVGTVLSPPRADALFAAGAADAVVDILSDMTPPKGVVSRAGRIAYKTGTSYRFRDGWAVGFDGARVIGVWMGRADGGSCACVGAAAAGVLFRLFDLLPPAPLLPRVLTPVFAASPPPALARLNAADQPPGDGDRPRITFPITQSHLLVDSNEASPIALTAVGGLRPYHWLVDGKPVDSRPFARQAIWQPESIGFSTIAVVDAMGRRDEAAVRLVARGEP